MSNLPTPNNISTTTVATPYQPNVVSLISLPLGGFAAAAILTTGTLTLPTLLKP